MRRVRVPVFKPLLEPWLDDRLRQQRSPMMTTHEHIWLCRRCSRAHDVKTRECMTDSEGSLLANAIGGDSTALTELLERHSSGIRSNLTGAIPASCQSLLSVDDVLQETYIDAFLGIHKFQPSGDAAFGAWLTTMAR